MRTYNLLIAFILLQTSCKSGIAERQTSWEAREDSVAKVMRWKPIRDNLYVSKFGDVGFRTMYHISESETVETYRTDLCCEEGNRLKDIIDIETFEQIGGDWGWGGYFKDKNHIYHFFGNSDGGNLSIVEGADRATFEIVCCCYGRDKNHIYDIRFGVMESINPEEFKILEYKNRCLAKYKDSYYWGNDKLGPEDLADPEMQEAIRLLEKL